MALSFIHVGVTAIVNSACTALVLMDGIIIVCVRSTARRPSMAGTLTISATAEANGLTGAQANATVGEGIDEQALSYSGTLDVSLNNSGMLDVAADAVAT